MIQSNALNLSELTRDEMAAIDGGGLPKDIHDDGLLDRIVNAIGIFFNGDDTIPVRPTIGLFP